MTLDLSKITNLHDEGLENGDLNKCRAINSFLMQAEKEMRVYNKERAIENLQRADSRIPKLQHIPSREKWKRRHDELVRHLEVMELYSAEVKPFKSRVKVFNRTSVQPKAYDCLYMLVKAIRLGSFCKELQIPPMIEFDDKDANAQFYLALVGDAPYSLVRTWMATGRNGISWPVLDKVCTVQRKSTDPSNSYSYRKEGAATFMLQYTLQHMNSMAEKLGISIFVVHVHAKANSLIWDKLYKKGFRYVLTDEEVKRATSPTNGKKPPVIYMDGDQPRINSIPLYMRLPNAKKETQQEHLAEIARVAREQLALVESPENQKKAERVLGLAVQRASSSLRSAKSQK
eukprot:CAMPEP_0184539870 /NCGR_PEP_ID=MMETSP0198_2-20121128/18352_1 /TAXON_ID=1112570 /ORGANISM="Thraustochytrium sp., Strain LLF1b" /LENGTH=343 /DNA_ID=CAMNT_0026933405 /DNA_START=278 /DNA_END=1309 /DNA_ORIENTATION=+